MRAATIENVGLRMVRVRDLPRAGAWVTFAERDRSGNRLHVLFRSSVSHGGGFYQIKVLPSMTSRCNRYRHGKIW